MRFEYRIEKEAVPEWRPKYVQYKHLKELLDLLPQTPHEEFDHVTGNYLVHSRDKVPLSEGEKSFLERIDLELAKVNEFYSLREKEALQRKYQILQQLKMLPAGCQKSFERCNQDNCTHPYSRHHSTSMSTDTVISLEITPYLDRIKNFRRRSAYLAARSRIKKALIEFYRSLDLLKNFRTLNYLALGKILKKFDKRTHRNIAPEYMEGVRTLPFFLSLVPESLTEDVENLFRRVFTGGDRSKALNKLRSPHRGSKSHQVSSTASGVLGGVMMALCVNIFKTLQTSSGETQSLALIYGGLGLPLFLSFLFSVNVMVWDSIHLNYRFIFEFDHRTALHCSELSFLIGTFCIFYLGFVSVSLSGNLDHLMIPIHQPCALLASLSIMLFLPIPIFFWTSRFWFVKILLRILVAPLLPVRFKDFFINDQIMSTSFTIQTVSLIIELSREKDIPPIDSLRFPSAWYFSAMISIPAMWRIMQSLRRFHDGGFYFFPHMANLLKYSLAFSLPFSGLLAEIYPSLIYGKLSLQFAASIYSLFWDVYMDWGLIQREALHYFLRETLLFPSQFIYFLAILLNSVIRFLWIIPAFKLHPISWHPLFISYALALIEVVRRFIWNFFRVEYEQVNNCNTLRAFTDIPLPYAAKDLFYQDMVEVEIAHHVHQVEEEEEHAVEDEKLIGLADTSAQATLIGKSDEDEEDDESDEESESQADIALGDIESESIPDSSINMSSDIINLEHK